MRRPAPWPRRPGWCWQGGTDVYAAAGRVDRADRIVDISRIDELCGIAGTDGHVRIGAGTTWSRIAGAALPACFDGLKAAAGEIGSRQIQNRATIGGNICNASPAADGIPALIALDAEVELVSQAGCRRLPLGDFVLGNRKTALGFGELLAAVLVPAAEGRTVSSFLKLGSRRYMVISIVMVAANIAVAPDGRVCRARIVVGSCSPVARRLADLESDLLGQRPETGLGRLAEPRHLAGLAPIRDDRASSAYRLDAALTLVRRALDDCGARTRP